MRPEDWWEARHARLVKNEESFRQYNNRRMEQEPVESDDDEERIPFLCECGDFTCVQALVMTAAEFADAHAAADRFVVLPVPCSTMSSAWSSTTVGSRWSRSWT